MFSIQDRSAKLCQGMTRREMIRVGGLSLLGLSLPSLLRARPSTGSTFGKAKNVIFLYLAGGPPQHETFDPKPQAPVEIRGPFKPICTNVPGIHFCELLPRTAAMTDKLAVIRSMSTNDNTHSSSSAWVLTGYKYRGPNARTIQTTDWPYFGSILKRFKPSEKLPPLSTVWLPDLMRLNENVTPAGQTGGFMGREWDPDRFVGNPNAEQYQVDGFAQTELPLMRLQNRRTLLKQVDAHFGKMDRSRSVNLYDKYQQQAFDLMTSGKARRAFDIAREPSKVRERYGRNRWGQCVLLARRLIEAGARLVHVQWPREPGDNAVDNPLWDTHAQNAERMEDVLAPQFDVGFSALVEDLDQRGLLEETLVVAIGEFGRTPKINNKGGRDHWGPVFSFVMAGAGISGGQVFGASDKSGGYPVENRIEPGDLTATIFHLTGLEPHATFFDKEGRVHHYSRGKPIDTILGHEPATEKRIESTGDPARVPVFDESAFLLAPDFQSPIPIKDAKESSRPRGWRATPLLNGNVNGFGVRVHDNHVSLGVRVRHSDKPLSLNKGTVALLAQEIRSPFAGAFTAKIDVKGLGDSQVFAKHFRSRLIFFQYQARNKNAMQRAEQASLVINPKFDSDWQSFELTKVFTNPNPGQNFSFGLGLGLAVIVEKMTVDVITQPEKDGQAMLLINSIKVEHNPKPRNEKVKV